METRQAHLARSKRLLLFALLALAAEENRLLLTRYQETCFGKARMWKVSGAGFHSEIWLWIFYAFLVFKTDGAASAETLTTVSEWFNTGHNVAVSYSITILLRNV